MRIVIFTSCTRHGVRSEVRWQDTTHLFNHRFHSILIVQRNSPSGASSLNKEDKERQISTLLYFCLREDANDILTSTNISNESRKKYTDVLAKFDAHFQVCKNMIFECVQFNRRVQEHEESVERFITSLYALSENCQYGGLKEEMICDRLVVGIRDSSLSKRL